VPNIFQNQSYKEDVQEITRIIWSFNLGFEKLQKMVAKAASSADFWFYNLGQNWPRNRFGNDRIVQIKELNLNLDELRESSPEIMSSLFSVLSIHNHEWCIRDLKTAMDFFKSNSYRVVMTCAVYKIGPEYSFYLFRKGLEQVIVCNKQHAMNVYSSSTPKVCWTCDDSNESFIDFLKKMVESSSSEESESKRLKITSE